MSKWIPSPQAPQRWENGQINTAGAIACAARIRSYSRTFSLIARALTANMLSLINPVRRPEPFDHPDWLFEAKFDGFRAAAHTVRGQLISRNGNRMQVFEKA